MVAKPEYGRPGRPSARARLMNAWTVSVPELCCSALRAIRIIARLAPAGRRAALTMSAWHPADPFGTVRPVQPGHPANRFESRCALGDVRFVDEPLANGDVEHGVGQRQVGAGYRLQMQIGVSCCRG